MDQQKKDYVQEGLKVLRDGGVVIFPTDTAFGIGCRMDDEEAVKKVFSLRKRPFNQAVPVLVSGKAMAEQYTLNIPSNVEKKLIDVFWPGALTIVLSANLKTVSPLVRGGDITIGVRSPNHLIPLSLINSLEVPLIGPSANFHGENTPYQLSDINPKLFALVDYVIPGVCSLKRESTVVDCTVDPWKVLRQGAINLEERIMNKE